MLNVLIMALIPHAHTMRFGGTAVVFGSGQPSAISARYAMRGFNTDVIPDMKRCQPHTLNFVNNLIVENHPYDVCHVMNNGLEDIRHIKDVRANPCWSRQTTYCWMAYLKPTSCFSIPL